MFKKRYKDKDISIDWDIFVKTKIKETKIKHN